jgi:HopA1 effector protein family
LFAILHDPALFHRYDGGTLWLSQADYLTFQTDLAQIYRSHHTEFAADTPLFTKQLAPGLGLAEVPSIGTFGLQRCEILATALVMATDRGQTAVADKLAAVTDRLAAAQIDRLQPYLHSAQIDRYELIIF